MASPQEMQQAMINRSIRTIKAELEYLCDASIISPATLSDLLSRVPPQTALHAPISVGAIPPPTQNAFSPVATPLPQMNNLSLHNTHTNGSLKGKSNGNYFSPPPPAAASPQPPAYVHAPPPPQASWSLCQAEALYQYSSTDEGDLDLQTGDRVGVTEYMNAEWWKGRSVRTGQEGIFPRSYVKVLDEKAPAYGTPAAQNNYGNMPLDVSQSGHEGGKCSTLTK